MKKRKKILNFLLFCLLLNPLSVSKVKAIEKDRQEESSFVIEQNLNRLRKIIVDSTGQVQLPDFKYSQVVQSSEGPLLQTLLTPPHRGPFDKLKSIFKPDRPFTHGKPGVNSMSSQSDAGTRTTTMQMTSKKDKRGNVRGNSDMGAPSRRNNVQNFMDQHSSGKHKTIYCYNKGQNVYQNAHRRCPCHTDPLYNMQLDPPPYHVKKLVNGRLKWVPAENQQSQQKRTNWRFNRSARLPLASPGKRWAWTQTQHGYQWLELTDPNQMLCFWTNTYMTHQQHNHSKCRCRSLGYGDMGPGLGGNVSKWQYQGKQ